jgi:hypothetical protein
MLVLAGGAKQAYHYCCGVDLAIVSRLDAAHRWCAVCDETAYAVAYNEF